SGSGAGSAAYPRSPAISSPASRRSGPFRRRSFVSRSSCDASKLRADNKIRADNKCWEPDAVSLNRFKRSASAATIPTGNDIPGRLSTRLLRWRENREVSTIARELIGGDLAIANGGQFATQERNRRAMFRRRTLEV